MDVHDSSNGKSFLVVCCNPKCYLIWDRHDFSRYMFDLSEKEAEELGRIQKNDIIDWHSTYLRQSSPKCRRLACSSCMGLQCWLERSQHTNTICAGYWRSHSLQDVIYVLSKHLLKIAHQCRRCDKLVSAIVAFRSGQKNQVYIYFLLLMYHWQRLS